MNGNDAIARIYKVHSSASLGFVVSSPGHRPPVKVVTSKASQIIFSEQSSQILLYAGDKIVTNSHTQVVVEFLIGGRAYIPSGSSVRLVGARDVLQISANKDKTVDSFIVGAARAGVVGVLTAGAVVIAMDAAIAYGTATAIGIGEVGVMELLQFLGMTAAGGAQVYTLNEISAQAKRREELDLFRARGVRG